MVIKPIFTIVFIVVLILQTSWSSADTAGRYPISAFASGSLAGWQEKSFAGKTDYQLVRLEGKQVLQASSQSSASGLFKESSVNLKKYPFLNWRWRIENRIESGNEKEKSGDDYVARIYLVINHKYLFWKRRAISYVWANQSEKGEIWNNAFAGESVKMFALRSAEDKTGRWVSEKRNVYEDLKLLFGEEISSIDAVAIMTDTDNSRSAARAFYADIYFSVD
ncbi:MAG: DUF3047 domain-containing protein [Gammaproteobacteria bacterium]|nr:DUF3047 domain-containing protein [Gammaproteobacteria bacterium]